MKLQEENRKKPPQDKSPFPSFPFCRGRIHAYTSISLELGEMIRHAMLMNTDKEWKESAKALVKSTLSRIEIINKPKNSDSDTKRSDV
jgi:hypothetical protein